MKPGRGTDRTPEKSPLRPASPGLVRLGSVARWGVYGASSLLFASGALWLVLHTWIRVEGAFGPEHHPLEAWLMRLHGLATLPAVLGLGALLPGHVLSAWCQRRKRSSGLPLLLAGLLLALGGWALYYVTGEAARPLVSISHWLLGLLLPALLLAHVLGARRERLADERAQASASRRTPGL